MDEQFTVKGIHGKSTMNRAAYEEYQQALKARQLEGRYTLEEAAQFVADNSNADARSIFTKLEKSAETGELTIHWPGSDEVYKPKPGSPQVMNRIILRGFEEAYWDDLNEWLNNNEPRLECKFTEPNFDKKFFIDEANRNGGRYQLAVAAMFIASHANAEVDSMMHKLFEAANAGDLKVYKRGMDEVYRFPPDWKSKATLHESEAYLEAKWHDLNDWLENKEPSIFNKYQFPKPDAPAAKGEAVLDTTLAQVTQNKLRRNNLDPAIDKAIKQAGNMELADVYLELKALALAEEKPFTGALDGNALCYTNDNNQPARLTKNALGKKLERRR